MLEILDDHHWGSLREGGRGGREGERGESRGGRGKEGEEEREGAMREEGRDGGNEGWGRG